MLSRLLGYVAASPPEGNQQATGCPQEKHHYHQHQEESRHNLKMLRRFGKKGSGKGQLNMPTGIAVTSLGDIVVVDSENSRLQVFSSEGVLRSRVGEKGSLPHQLNHPMMVALSRDGDENLVVTDSVNAAVKVFMADGTFVTQHGVMGMFDFPYGVAVTQQHHLVVTDICQHSVLVLYPSGSLRNKFGQYGDGPRDLDHPYSVTVDKSDQVIVADSGNTCIKRFDLDGHLLQCFTLGDFRLYNEHFVLLAGITTDAEDNVIVIGNATVYVAAPNGRLWEVVLPSDGLHSPKAVAASPLGQLVVSQCGLDSRHEVSVFRYNSHDYRSLQSVPRSAAPPQPLQRRRLEPIKTSVTFADEDRADATCTNHHLEDSSCESNRNNLD